MDYKVTNNLSEAELSFIASNIEKANIILKNIDESSCIKNNHECDKVKEYLDSL
jgi:hypothetical protein